MNPEHTSILLALKQLVHLLDGGGSHLCSHLWPPVVVIHTDGSILLMK
jgi:hypothetical protein